MIWVFVLINCCVMRKFLVIFGVLLVWKIGFFFLYFLMRFGFFLERFKVLVNVEFVKIFIVCWVNVFILFMMFDWLMLWCIWLREWSRLLWLLSCLSVVFLSIILLIVFMEDVFLLFCKWNGLCFKFKKLVLLGLF